MKQKIMTNYELLKLVRKHREMSQKEIARRSKLQPSFISALERGVCPITEYTAKKISKVLGINYLAIMA